MNISYIYINKQYTPFVSFVCKRYNLPPLGTPLSQPPTRPTSHTASTASTPHYHSEGGRPKKRRRAEPTQTVYGHPLARLGLYTILSLPLLYSVWHTQGGRVGAAYCALVVQ